MSVTKKVQIRLKLDEFCLDWMIPIMKSTVLKGSQLYFQEEIESANSCESVALLCPQVSGAAL